MRNLSEHIENMLDAVLELDDQSAVKADSQMSLLCSYGFPTSGAGTPGELEATTPILLVPTQLLSSDQTTEFSLQLSDRIQNWPGWPGGGGPGAVIFDLRVFSSIGSGASGPALKPILEFENLRVPLAHIIPETE